MTLQAHIPTYSHRHRLPATTTGISGPPWFIHKAQAGLAGTPSPPAAAPRCSEEPCEAARSCAGGDAVTTRNHLVPRSCPRLSPDSQQKTAEGFSRKRLKQSAELDCTEKIHQTQGALPLSPPNAFPGVSAAGYLPAPSGTPFPMTGQGLLSEHVTD